MKSPLLLVMLGTLSLTALQARADTLVLHPDTRSDLSLGSIANTANLGASLTSAPATFLLTSSNGLHLGEVKSFVTIAPAPTPEPATLGMMATGVAGIFAAYKRRRSAA